MRQTGNKVANALQRKVGPFPVWIWAIIAFAGIWYYRNRLSAGAATTVGTTAPTPQDQTVLAPGESIYDPNTGMLTTAPGGTTGGDGGGTQGDPGTPGAPGAPGKPGKPGRPGRPAPPRLRGKGAVRAPSGHKRPPSKKGYTTRGLGGGFWEYLPKRTKKQKHQHGKPKPTTKTPKTKKTTRSNAMVRAVTGGRTTGHSRSPVSSGRVRGGVKPQATTARATSSRTMSLIGNPTLIQRPVANMTPKAPTRPAQTAPRPSSPPARTSRTPRPAAKHRSRAR